MEGNFQSIYMEFKKQHILFQPVVSIFPKCPYLKNNIIIHILNNTYEINNITTNILTKINT